ncbi:MAG: adenosylcobinamide-phosphate synthase CbiB [Pseudomonadota bacterium]
MFERLASVAAAQAVDALIGEPDALWSRFPHPVVSFGRLIGWVDRTLNFGPPRVRRWMGVVGLIISLAVACGIAQVVALALSVLPASIEFAVTVGIAGVLLAHRSLHEHVRAVALAPDLPAQRRALSMIVGRQTKSLDEPAIARGAIEALSESLSDGVIAPAFWLAVGGLPGIVAYKVVNTADSMIGHRTPRHENFGWASARLDDAMNIVPARLTALLTLVCARILPPRKQVAADAGRHVSPNAGWPEAAFAHALGIALGGPRRYGERELDGAWLNGSGREARLANIAPALALSTRVGVAHAVLYGALAVLAIAIS